VRLLFIEHRERLAACGLLLVVDLAEIEQRSLHGLVGTHAPVLDDAEVAVILAVFLAVAAAKKHDSRRVPEHRKGKKEARSSPGHFFRTKH